ncbi:Protein MON2 homolog [Eumeta japonica]|uniref:Protein MON2 homolog n=1 Tax=Eumeta variegata TaxID=151549 RepID=A0A4C1SFD7_EUMVA|nr:Protein MON2 homolog [Eumeta japonica]
MAARAATIRGGKVEIWKEHIKIYKIANFQNSRKTFQRLIAQQGIDAKGARHIVDCLYNLGQANLLELKLLQTAALLMTTSDLVHGDTLARTMVMCIRMVSPSETRDASTSHAAAATVRQLVAIVFERALAEADGELRVNPADVRPQTNSKAPKDLKPCAVDAYLILQDIIQLINGDTAHWLVGISDVPKTFGLELLDTVLTDFSPIFFKITEFRFLLKEHVCALIIRLFSPNVKYRAAFTSLHIPGAQPGSAPGQASPATSDRPHFPVSMRLLRLVSVIIHKYHSILVTECEIFLSLTIKFLDPDKPLWQRALALEVLHKMSIQPKLLKSFCECYDMKPHATNIFQDIVNALGAYVQSLFVASQVNTPAGASTIPQHSGFYWKGVWLPLCVTFEPGNAKSVYLEMLERTEAPSIQDGYGISVAYACLTEIIRSIAITVEGAEYFRCNIIEVEKPATGIVTAMQYLCRNRAGLVRVCQPMRKAFQRYPGQTDRKGYFLSHKPCSDNNEHNKKRIIQFGVIVRKSVYSRKGPGLDRPPAHIFNVTALWSENVTPRTTYHFSALSIRMELHAVTLTALWKRRPLLCTSNVGIFPC